MFSRTRFLEINDITGSSHDQEAAAHLAALDRSRRIYREAKTRRRQHATAGARPAEARISATAAIRPASRVASCSDSRGERPFWWASATPSRGADPVLA